MEFGIVFAVFLFFVLLIRNRIRSAILQSKKEILLREIIRITEQRKKIDELYGRENGNQ